MIVKRVMTPNPITVKEADTLITAAERMINGSFSRLPVVNEAGKLVGILSEHDLCMAVGAPAVKPEDLTAAGLAGKKVSAYMTPDPIVVAPTTSIVRAAKLMRQHDIGGLPVTRHGELVGIVVEADLLDYFIELVEQGAITAEEWARKLGGETS